MSTIELLRVEYDTYLDTREVAEGVHEVLSDFICYLHTDTSTYQVIVPKGFITDFASVPRIPFAYLLFGSMGNYAAVLHDGLYNASDLVKTTDYDTERPYIYDRAFADTAFYLGLIERKIPAWKAKMMYWGVRWKGGQFYKAKPNEWQRDYAT